MANNLNKKNLIDAIADKTDDVTKKDIESVLNAFMETVTEAAKKDDKITLVGFGTFSQVQRKATIKQNPKTGEKINVPAKKVMKFKTSKSLNDSLN